ncbi:MAG: glycosyltransferase family 1 protein [Burkholderiales bacterium]|nr:glycosyltransferase family 1 protein [Opitutaceae bacterium]
MFFPKPLVDFVSAPSTHRSNILPAITAVSASRSASGTSASSVGAEAESNPPRAIIAICHLGWDWVWQRPQQFLSRLAKRHPVLFVETHRTPNHDSFTHTRVAQNHPEVTILEIHLPAGRWADGAFIDAERRRVLRDRLAGEFADRYDDAILWFNDPMAVTAYAGHLGESMIVYDCMDELAQFNGAPPEMVTRERELIRLADVIFCGGRKMRDKRLPLNPNTHFYGTGVDCVHFGSALSTELASDPEIAALPGPVLGYFGVLDERIDYALVAALADAFPEGSIAMVGPVAKVDPAALPQRPNLHWLGGRPYIRLPAITKGFDACLMPFARNASTEFINPTKALEYMAAGRPVISTALDEVRTNFSTVARVADTHAEFIRMCRQETTAPSRARVKRGLKLAAENTWEAIAAKMDAHVADVFTARARREAQAAVAAAAEDRAAALQSARQNASLASLRTGTQSRYV